LHRKLRQRPPHVHVHHDKTVKPADAVKPADVPTDSKPVDPKPADPIKPTAPVDDDNALRSPFGKKP
jgi:hypothetical protein